jgi:hypothetical protein
MLKPYTIPGPDDRDWATPYAEDELALMEGMFTEEPGPWTPRVIRLIATIRATRNAALEDAAIVCERSQSGHGKRKGGSNTGDAARRNCAILIRDLKTPPLQGTPK